MKFSEHLKYLSEGKLNEEKGNDKTFSEEVKNFFLDKFPYAKLDTQKVGEHISVKLDKFKQIGEYQANVYPEVNNKISFTLTLVTPDSEFITLMYSGVKSTTTKDYQKFAEKWFKNSAKIIEDLSDIGN